MRTASVMPGRISQRAGSPPDSGVRPAVQGVRPAVLAHEPAVPGVSRAASRRSPVSGLRPVAGLRRPAGLQAAVLMTIDALGLAAAAAAAGIGPARGTGYGVLVVLCAGGAGLYRARIGGRVSDQAARLAGCAALPALVLLVWTSGPAVLRLGLTAAGLLIGLRAVTAAGLRWARRRGLLTGAALIVGGGDQGRLVYRLLSEHPELGLRPCGVLDNQLAARPEADAVPLLGPVAAAGAVLSGFGVSQVLVCAQAVPDSDLAVALGECRQRGVRVSVQPRPPVLGLAVPRACLDDVWGIPFVPLRPGPGVAGRRSAKRGLDLLAGTGLLLVAAPLMLLLTPAVWLNLRLPPLFRQVRLVGQGKLAPIIKLRTLRPAGDPDTSWAVTAEQATRLGRMLRNTHVDELPQLVSVVRGDMSLVGPRPERPYFARQLRRSVPGYAGRERVRAGLTGWAQVHGLTGDTSLEDRVRFDNFYVEYGSLWLDLVILARTGVAALSGALSARGAVR